MVSTMEGVDVHLAVIRPKPFHKPPKNEFQANFYDILLLEIAQSESRILKMLPQVAVPYQEDPRVKVVNFLYFLTGADRGGLQGLCSTHNINNFLLWKTKFPNWLLFCHVVTPNRDLANLLLFNWSWLLFCSYKVCLCTSKCKRVNVKSTGGVKSCSLLSDSQFCWLVSHDFNIKSSE